MAKKMGYQYETSPRKLEPEYIPTKKKINKAKKSTKKVKAKLVHKDFKTKRKAILYVAILFAILLVISYRNSQITEQFSEVRNLKNDLATLEKENKQLEVNIESSINLNNIEKEATELLGMQKLTNEQKIYVSLPKKDYIQPTSEDVLNTEKNKNLFKTVINTLLGK